MADRDGSLSLSELTTGPSGRQASGSGVIMYNYSDRPSGLAQRPGDTNEELSYARQSLI